MIHLRVLFVLLTLSLGVSFTSCSCGKMEDELHNEEAKLPPSDFAEAMLEEHNLVRTDPSAYAEKIIKPLLARGDTPVQECYNALKACPPMARLALDDRLNKAAQWFADDHAVKKKIGHMDSQGCTPKERMKKQGISGRMWAENCSYGLKEVRQVMLQLLIDEDTPDRGHRKNILNKELTHLGVGFSTQQGVPYGSVVVLDYATL